MSGISSGYLVGYHGCDKTLGLRLINGKDELKPSKNSWDWLGNGVYFWENDPARALHYSLEKANGTQKSTTLTTIPFVIGAIIDLGKCLNLVEVESMSILSHAYEGLREMISSNHGFMPKNIGHNRALDCAVLNYIHISNQEKGISPYDSIRCAFPEGGTAFPGSSITEKLHIQLCVRNQDHIKGYFLPKPWLLYNPFLELH